MHQSAVKDRVNVILILKKNLHMRWHYLFSAKPITRLYSKVSCALRIVEKPPCDHGVFLGVIEVIVLSGACKVFCQRS